MKKRLLKKRFRRARTEVLVDELVRRIKSNSSTSSPFSQLRKCDPDYYEELKRDIEESRAGLAASLWGLLGDKKYAKAVLQGVWA